MTFLRILFLILLCVPVCYLVLFLFRRLVTDINVSAKSDNLKAKQVKRK